MPHLSLPLPATRHWRFGAKVAVGATIALFSVIPTTSSVEQDLKTPFEFFDQSCLTPGPQFQAMTALAAGKNWSPLPDKVLRVLTPIANPSALSGWIASGDDENIKVVVVSKGSLGSKPVEGCTVGFYGVDSRAFEKAMAGRAGGPGSSAADDTPNRINIVFNTASSAGLAEFVTLSLPDKVEEQDQVIASVLAEGRPVK